MPLVVVSGAVIQCGHGGQLKLAGGSGKAAVEDAGIVLSASEVGLTFSPTPVGDLSPCTGATAAGSPAPCKTLVADAGVSTKLTIGGVAALLDTAKGKTASEAGPGTWTVAKAGQDVLTAD